MRLRAFAMFGLAILIGLTVIPRQVQAAASFTVDSTAGASVEFEIGLNFTGTTRNEFGAGSVPDTMGSVGPNHIVELLNNAYAVYNKETGSLISRISQDDFWNTALANAEGGTTAFSVDPRVIYDHISGRWFASSLDRLIAGQRRILVGVSNSSDPTDGWNAFLIDPDPTDLERLTKPLLEQKARADDGTTYGQESLMYVCPALISNP